MKCFNLFKLVLWLFQSLAKLVILLYKRSRMLLYRAASYLTMTEATDPKKKKKKDDDDVNMYDDYEEDEEEDEDICGSGSSSSGDECYDDGSSSSSGSSGSSVCRQRRNKQQQQQRNNNNNSQQLQQNEGNTSKSVILRNIRAKKELVLDLDETLVHSTTEWAVSYHFTVTVKLPCDVLAGEADVLQTSEKQQQQQCFSQQRHEQEEQKPGEDLYPAVFYVTKRPHLDTFLKKVSKWYNLSVFTSSLRAYAEPVIDQIDNHHLIKKRFYRDSCSDFGDGIVQKELSVLGTDLSKVILVDNCAEWFSRYKENVLPIPSWTGDNPRDEGLLNLLPVLNALRYVNDVRSILCLRTLSD